MTPAAQFVSRLSSSQTAARIRTPLATVAAHMTACFTNSAVYVLKCGHQFHLGCLSTWWRTQSNLACPLCKKSA